MIDLLKVSDGSFLGLFILAIVGFVLLIVICFLTMYYINKVAPKDAKKEEE